MQELPGWGESPSTLPAGPPHRPTLPHLPSLSLQGGCVVLLTSRSFLPRRFCMQKCVSLVPGVTLDLIEK